MKWLIKSLGKIPLKVMLSLVAACLVFGEQYPFSDFPMFGSFTGKTYYLYLADQNGKPIPAMNFAVPTNGIKKFYDGRLRKIKKAQNISRLDSVDDTVVAEQTLRYLLPKAKKRKLDITSLQLVRVDVSVQNTLLVKQSRIAGEIPFP